jgi:hypothetical protein
VASELTGSLTALRLLVNLAGAWLIIEVRFFVLLDSVGIEAFF